ncbi:unnamed protein product [Prorocentrum cordatum]|uniref:Pentatricopeptide repeat-containing protein, chloroplastic n=1 Tax=Prorocentrum cordatum TaxID=2364126 RepID=A0ABN9V1Z5_9DINO|nr:unnamed protein product [Polarella glacialis]
MRAVAVGYGIAPRHAGCAVESQCRQLQRWDQRVQERQAVAARFGTARRDAGGEVGAQRYISATTLGSARARTVSTGSGPWRCSARCGRRSWSPAQLQRRNQRLREVRAVAVGFRAAGRDAGGAVGSQLSYSAGISACEKGVQWQRALVLISDMREAKLEADVVSYNAGISACEKGGQWQRALALLSEIWEAKLSPSITSYSAAISACEKCWQWQRALELLNEIHEATLEPNDTLLQCSG